MFGSGEVGLGVRRVYRAPASRADGVVFDRWLFVVAIPLGTAVRPPRSSG
ncbi:hypothetical protein [Actinopolyspora halophila]|nr:hypothetical protein [Actinopolyspora halophila]